MADEIIAPAAPAAPVQAAAPVADAAGTPAPSAAPAASPTYTGSLLGGAPEPVKAAEPVTPAAEPVAVAPAEPVKAEEPAKAAEPAKAVEPVKPAEGDKLPEAKKDESAKSVEPAPAPVFEPWTLPEGVKLDEKQTSEFNTLLGELQTTTKAEQAFVQKFGQTLVDKYIAAVNESVDRTKEAYNSAWVRQTEDWKESFVKDPEIGGKRQETTLKLANEFLDTHFGTPENVAKVRKVLFDTGLGCHPELIRGFANAMTRYSEGKPLAANPPVSKPSRTARMYGIKTN